MSDRIYFRSGKGRGGKILPPTKIGTKKQREQRAYEWGRICAEIAFTKERSGFSLCTWSVNVPYTQGWNSWMEENAKA